MTLSQSYRAHRLLADRVPDDGNVSGYCFLLPSEFICRWISRDETIHVWWDEGQIMKVINQKKQPNNSRFCSLVSFTKLKSHEKENIHPTALSPNISSLEDETKISSFLTCNQKKNQIFYMLLQYKSDKIFDLAFEENRSLLSSMTAKICLKMLMKSS